MKKVLLILAMTLTIMSCSKDTVDFDPNKYDTPAQLSIAGVWGGTFTDGVNGFLYAVDFGNGSITKINAYASNDLGADCLYYEGYWNIVSRTANSVTITGDEDNKVTLTKTSSTTRLNLSGMIYGLNLTGVVDAVDIIICN